MGSTGVSVARPPHTLHRFSSAERSRITTAPADNDPMDASSLQSALPATAPATDASSAPLFGTSNDHLLWNGLSYLNQELARRLAHQPGEILVHATQSSVKGNHRGSYEWQQDVFCNILVRKVEVVASILASVDPKPVATSNPNDFAHIAQPKILIAANPRKEDHDKLDRKADKVRIAAMAPPALDTTQGVVGAVLRKYQELRGHVLFPTHVGWFIGLLSDCHVESLDNAAYDAARKALGEYVYIASYPKMLARLNIGTSVGGGNFFEVMTASIARFPLGSFDSPIPEDLANVRPNIQQQQTIRILFDRVATNDGEEWVGSGATPQSQCRSPLYDLAGRKFFHGMLSMLLKSACQALRDLSNKNKSETTITDASVEDVTQSVSRARKSVIDLNVFLLHFAMAPFDSDRLDLLSHHLAWLSDRANVKGRSDTPFGAKTPDGIPGSILKASLGTPQFATQAGSDSKTPSGSPGSIPKASASTSQDDDGGDDGDDGGGNADVDADTDALDDLLQLTLFQTADGKADTKPGANGWAAAGHKYLNLICLHEVSLSTATPRVRDARTAVKSHHVRNADVKVMDIKFDNYPTKRRSVKDCLDMILAMKGSGNLSRDELVDRITIKMQGQARLKHERQLKEDAVKKAESDQHLIAQGKEAHPLAEGVARPLAEGVTEAQLADKLKTVRDNWLGKSDFKGSMHCETIIMSVILLTKAIPASMTTGEWLEHNGIFGLQNTVLALARNPLSILNVSKRCCPPCENMVKLIIRKGAFVSDNEVVVAYPGYHTKWTATSLPPFLLKEYVDECLGFAKREVLNKLQELQRRIDADKESSADSASPGSNTYSADQDLSQYEMLEGWDHDVPVTDSKDSRKRGADAPEPGSESPTKMNRKKDDDGDIDIKDS